MNVRRFLNQLKQISLTNLTVSAISFVRFRHYSIAGIYIIYNMRVNLNIQYNIVFDNKLEIVRAKIYLSSNNEK